MFWKKRKLKTDTRVDDYLGDRLIFEYFDGSRIVKADPMVLWRGMADHEKFNMETHPELIDAGDWEAYQIMLDAVREVFHVGPYSTVSYTGDLYCEIPHGLTETETMNLWAEFSGFLEDIQKKTNDGVTLSALMDLGSSSLLEPPSEIMPPLSDSGSTTTEPREELPTAKSEPSMPPPPLTDSELSGSKP